MESLNLNLVKESGAETLEYFIWSSCQRDTPWMKGSGTPIQSWLRSIIYYHKNESVSSNEGSKSNPVVGSFENHPVRDGHLGDATGIENMVEIHTMSGTLRWKKFGPGFFDGWLYGDVDASGQFTGNDIAYIYSDLITVIYGTFDKGTLINGRERKVKGFRCKSGMMEIQFSKYLNKDQVFKYEEVNATFLTSQPTLMDPLERRNIFVANSTISGMTCGDGIYAKKNIPANALVSVYAGLKLPTHHEYPTNFTTEEREDHHKNLLGYGDNLMIDIPPHLDDILIYRASLGHKLNHDFERFSTEFCYLNHPRFGPTRCLRSLRSIKKGEEIFDSYNYDTSSDGTPRWYKKLDDEHKLKQKEVTVDHAKKQ